MGDWIRPRKLIMERFRQIFTGLMRAHGCTYVDKKGADGLKVKGKSFVKREPVTDDMWQKHLDGKDRLGVIPINDYNTCKWGCIDIDEYPLDHSKLVERIRHAKLPLVVCRSKSGGAHCFIFSTDWVPAKTMQSTLQHLASGLGYGGSEIFPKQIKLF